MLTKDISDSKIQNVTTPKKGRFWAAGLELIMFFHLFWGGVGNFPEAKWGSPTRYFGAFEAWDETEVMSSMLRLVIRRRLYDIQIYIILDRPSLSSECKIGTLHSSSYRILGLQKPCYPGLKRQHLLYSLQGRFLFVYGCQDSTLEVIHLIYVHSGPLRAMSEVIRPLLTS